VKFSKFSRFCIAGGTGFIVDAGLCQLLVDRIEISPLISRVISIGVAMLVTWSINRSLTFGRSSSSAPVEWIKYVFVTSAGAVANYLVFALCVATIPGFGLLAGVAAGSLTGLVLNYHLANNLVFTGQNPAR
jgi:putative flippase GtrA